MIVLMRPTMSPVLHVQMIGRGLRMAEGKQDCLVLDFAGNVRRLGPINNVAIPTPGVRSGNGKAPTKICPECSEIVHLSASVCTACGHEFPGTALRLTSRASAAAVLTSEVVEPDRFRVQGVRYRRHLKEGNSRATLRVEYRINGWQFMVEWIPFESTGYLRQKAERWWRARAHTMPPKTVAEAMEHINELRVATWIRIKPNAKYKMITHYWINGNEIRNDFVAGET